MKHSLFYSVCAAVLMVMYITAGCTALEPAVVDNSSKDFTKVSGKWNPSTRDPNYEGDNYLWCRKGKGDAKVTWKYAVQEKGTYKVQVKWVGSKPTDRATNAPYTVKAGKEEKTVRVDMSKRNLWGKWFDLGSYSVSKGEEILVTLTNDSDNSVVADAVKIELKGEEQKEDSKDGVVFSDDFSKGIDNWVIERWSEQEAQYKWDKEKKGLHVTTRKGTNGVMVWCKKELPENFKFEYDVTPLSPSGFFLIFFCAKGINGEDILSEKLIKTRPPGKTLFKKYTKWNINCYHISYRRNRIADCNFRKNSGQKLLKKHRLDKILDKDKTVHVELYKKGGHMKLTVDGMVFMDYTDKGKGQPIWKGGRIGFRQVYESDGLYDNVKITEIK